MNVVVFHNGSTLLQGVVHAWAVQHSRMGSFHLVQNCVLEKLIEYKPKLVILTSDTPSEFERLVIEKCRDLQLSILPVLGRSSTVLVGPLERPDVPGCATCLQLRWENTFEQSLFGSIFLSPDGTYTEPLELSPSELLALGSIVVSEARSVLLESTTPPSCAGQVGVFESGGQLEWVPVLPSHDCPRCNVVPDDNQTLGELSFSSHMMNDLETLRVGTVDDKRLEQWFVHPKVGYISSVNEFSNGDRYMQADAYIYTPAGADIAGYGSGLSSNDAKQSAILEVLERSCGYEAVNRRPVVRGAYSVLGDKAIHPSQFGLHSYELLESSNRIFHFLEPYDDAKQYSWVWAHSTKSHEPVLIPEQIAYYGPTADGKRFVTESSNGCAIGGTLEEAILHGIFEVLERDGFLNMWYAKMPVSELGLGPQCPPKVFEVYHYLEGLGFEVRLFQLSHDLGIPIISAVAVHRSNAYPKVVSGSACHLNPYQAVYGALREVSVHVLNLLRVSDEKRKQALPLFHNPKAVKDILDHAAVAALPEAYPTWTFLLRRENGVQIPSVEEAYPDVDRQFSIDSRDIRLILNAVLDHLHARGFDVIVINQTSVEVSYAGLHAVKAIIPGMTPITWGYGFQRVRGLRRIFELPYRLGYSPRVLTEQDLNRDCHPFS